MLRLGGGQATLVVRRRDCGCAPPGGWWHSARPLRVGAKQAELGPYQLAADAQARLGGRDWGPPMAPPPQSWRRVARDARLELRRMWACRAAPRMRNHPWGPLAIEDPPIAS